MVRRLSPAEDAYGQEIWAYYNGKNVAEIVENADGYISVSKFGPKGYFSDYEDWAPYTRKALGFVKGRVLDIGCGAGRCSLYLQKKGFDVTGIDNSPLAIRVCKMRGLKKAKLVAVEDLNFKSNSFDTIIMMGNNFGLLGSFAKAQRLLKKFRSFASRNAMIIADTRDPYKTDNPAYLEYHKMNKKKGRLSGQIRLRIRFEKYVGRWLDYLMVSKGEMIGVLNGTGWNVKDFIDSDNSQYIALIEKQSSGV